MLKRKISAIIVLVAITNLIATPANVFAEWLTNEISTETVQNQGPQNRIDTIVSNFGVSDENLQRYNEEFKIDNSKIIRASNTGGTSNRTNIMNVLDGDLNTFWESGRVNTSTYNNEVEFEFNESVTINRLVYSAKRGTNRGFVQEFEIYASSTSEGEFQLISKGQAVPTQETLEFKFSPTKVKKLKLVYKKGVDGWAAASEFGFYKEDEVKDKVQSLFTDSTYSRVNEKFNSLDKIEALEQEVKSHILYSDFKEDIENAKALIRRGEVVATEAEVSNFKASGDNLGGYNKEFKVSRENITKASNTGGTSNQTKIENVLDGDLNTFWESGRVNTSTYNNEVEFEFDKVTRINRIVYGTRRGTNRGFAQEFEIYASPTTKGDTFKLISKGKADATQDILEFKFKPTDVKRVKFVYKKGVEGWAAASEFGFYKEDIIQDKVEKLFTDGTMTSLKSEYNNITVITELEKQVSSHPLSDKLQEVLDLAKSVINKEVDFSNNIFTLKQDGDVVKHIEENLKMGRFGTNLQSTGIVAKAGEKFNIYVEVEDDKPLPKIVFTQQEGHYSNWNRTYNLKKGLNTITVPKIYDENWVRPNNKGGAVYLVNPYTPEEQGKAPIVRIDGGEHFPLFNEGDNKEVFLEKLRAYKEKLDTNPNTMIDIFEFNSGRVMFTGTAKAAYKVYIDENRDIEASIKTWDKQIQKGIEFAGLSDEDKDIRHNSKNIKTAIRLMQPHGAAYADKGHIGVQRHIMEIFLREDEKSMNSIIWGTMHEVGHQFDIPAREWAEETNNMWANYASILNNKGDQINYNNIYKDTAADGAYRESTAARFDMFWQLQMADENYWPNLERMYREEYPTIKSEQQKRDTFAIYSSRVLGVNLTTYFDKYNFGISNEAKEELAKLPDSKKVWYANNKTIGYKGNGFTSDVNVTVKSIKFEPQKGNILNLDIDNENKEHLLGYEIVKNGKVIGFTSGNNFVDAKGDVDINTIYEVIPYDIKLNPGKKSEGQSHTPNIKLSKKKVTLALNEEFNAKEYVKGLNYLGEDISENIQIVNNVNTKNKGMYTVSYTLVDEGITVSNNIEVEVVSKYDYLSDYGWKSVSTEYGTPRRNRDIKVRQLGEIKTFEKGFGIHANGKIVYDLSDKNYENFEAILGVDMGISSQNRSSISFKIIGDGQVLASTGVIKHADDAAYVNVPVNGIKELIIEVTDGGDGISSDHAVIANPKLTNNNVKPVINVSEEKTYLKLGESLNLMDGVSASDTEDGNITSNIVIDNDGFNSNKSGKYNVKYTVTDTDGNIIEKSREVIVYSKEGYLSDNEWESATAGWKNVKKDLAVNTNNKIKLNVNGEIKTFDKGFGTATNSEIIYNLEGKNYDYFTAYVGTDKNYTHNSTSIIFKVYADGKEVYTSSLIRKDSLAEYINIAITGVKELKLVALDNGDGGLGDFASWGDCKLYTINEKTEVDAKSESKEVPAELVSSNSEDLIENKELTSEVIKKDTLNNAETLENPRLFEENSELIKERLKLKNILEFANEINDVSYVLATTNKEKRLYNLLFYKEKSKELLQSNSNDLEEYKEMNSTMLYSIQSLKQTYISGGTPIKI